MTYGQANLGLCAVMGESLNLYQRTIIKPAFLGNQSESWTGNSYGGVLGSTGF